MGKKVTKPVIIAVTALILLVIAFMMRGSLRGPARVVLPEEIESSGEVHTGSENEAIDRIDIRPSTVQAAIATLSRPQEYSRTLRIERYYSGGSAVEEAEVFVRGEWMRTDLTRPNGETRHVITGGGKSRIWYGSSRRWYEGAALLSADEEQSIPTYEDVLLLDTTSIALADYRMLDSKDCIYVATAADSGGYVERYWVSLEDGLLVAAEKSCGDEVVYRMAGLGVNTEIVKDDAFTLPDGTVLNTAE